MSETANKKPINQALVDTQPAGGAASITDNATTHNECVAIYIGTSTSYDFYIGGSWITFQNVMTGSILPLRATGARKTMASAAPSAGDIVFLY
jgi:hypothetical protein